MFPFVRCPRQDRPELYIRKAGEGGFQIAASARGVPVVAGQRALQHKYTGEVLVPLTFLRRRLRPAAMQAVTLVLHRASMACTVNQTLSEVCYFVGGNRPRPMVLT